MLLPISEECTGEHCHTDWLRRYIKMRLERTEATVGQWDRSCPHLSNKLNVLETGSKKPLGFNRYPQCYEHSGMVASGQCRGTLSTTQHDTVHSTASQRCDAVKWRRVFVGAHNLKRFMGKLFAGQFSRTATLINAVPVSFMCAWKTLFVG
jgi:hypothetical protein